MRDFPAARVIFAQSSTRNPCENMNCSFSYVKTANYVYADYEFPDYSGDRCQEFAQFLRTYIIPAIIVFGLVGNLLAALIFLTTKLKKRSSSVYLGTLSLADFGFLLMLLVAHISYVNIIDLYNINGLCQLFVFTSTVCSDLSVWLIVAFTIERFIAVKYPLHRPWVCTVKRARCITLSIFCFALVSQLYIFWTAGIVTSDYGSECEMRREYSEFMRIINYLDTLITLIIPLLVIVALNAMIARALIVFRGRLFTNQIEESSSNASCVAFQEEGLQVNVSNLEYTGGSSTPNCNINIVHYERNLLTAKSQRHITKMLLLISTVFVLLNVPSYALRFYVFTLNSVLEQTVPLKVRCVQDLSMTLFYANYSINFLLYSMYGATFRQALIIFLLSNFRRVARMLRYFQRKN